jgi:3-deoxy-manno-octulosonate cytidylyltransferase (CMP-KDO synthetase)
MSSKPNVIGVIPARYASQRLPAKPLVDLLGKTMIQRVYEQVKKAALLDRVLVATDDERIANVVRGFGGEVVLTSPAIKSGSDRVAAVADRIEGDIFVNVQGDEPLIDPQMVDHAVKLLLADPSVPMGTLAKQIHLSEELFNPSIVKVVFNRKMEALYFSRAAIPFVRDQNNAAQWLENHTFFKHVGLYVYRRDFLAAYTRLPEGVLEWAERLEQLRVLENGYRIKVGLTEYESVPIDTKEDVARVIALLQSKI